MKITTSQLRKIIEEEFAAMTGADDSRRYLHGYEAGHPGDDEGYMAKSRLFSVSQMAEELCNLLKSGDQLPGWVQDHLAVAHENLQQIHGYMMGDEALRNQAMAPVQEHMDDTYFKLLSRKFMHPTKPPSAPKCAECGKKLSPAEKTSYEAEGGQGYPEVCMDCAEEAALRVGMIRTSLSEGHARITNEEFAAWKRGDWGFVSETIEGYREMTADEAAIFIASKDPSETVEQDVIDVDSGEIYAEKGKSYGASPLHPHRTKKRIKSRPSLHVDANDDLDDTSESVDMHAEYSAALKEFAAHWGENPVPDDTDPQDVASDAALSFFHMYPQWRTWAASLGLTKADIQSAAAEAVYEETI